MLRLRVADEGGVFLAIVLKPVRQFFLAVSVTHAADKLAPPPALKCGRAADSAKWSWDPGERIAFFRAAQHRPLTIQVNEIAKENDQQKNAGSCRNADLVARKLHGPHISLA